MINGLVQVCFGELIASCYVAVLSHVWVYVFLFFLEEV